MNRKKNLPSVYTSWHWGSKPTKIIEWDDPDFPDDLVEIGRLAELYVRGPADGTAEKGRKVLVPEREVPACHLAFDPAHRFQRLYLLLSVDVRRACKRQWWNPHGATYPLAAVAKAAGGRHATPDYPAVEVQPVGILTHITYLTEKTGDAGQKMLGWKDANYYIHHMGEESGIQPMLCIDSGGRLWFAGGNSTAPTPGITD